MDSYELSKVGQNAISIGNQPLLVGLNKYLKNQYDPDSNPKGIINLGTAENKLMFDVLLEKLNSLTHISGDMLSYGSFFGSLELRQSIADVWNDHLEPKPPIQPEQITIHAGCGAVVSNIFQALVNPGEGVLVPTPFYGGFDFDLTMYAQACIIPVPSSSTSDFIIQVSDLEKAYNESSKKIKALLLTNPQNPQGTIITASRIHQFLIWAKSKKLHVVVDEIYALSVFDKECIKSFVSVLNTDLPDPQNTHVVWSISKDFTMNGIRLGACITRNETLAKAMSFLAVFTNVSSLSDRLITHLFQDRVFVAEFIKENRSRLAAQYTRVTDFLDHKKISYLDANAAFFIWIDLNPFLHRFRIETDLSTTDLDWRIQAEKRLWMAFIDDGSVLISSGGAFHCNEPGWFRIVYSLPWSWVQEGLERMCRVLGV